MKVLINWDVPDGWTDGQLDFLASWGASLKEGLIKYIINFVWHYVLNFLMIFKDPYVFVIRFSFCFIKFEIFIWPTHMGEYSLKPFSWGLNSSQIFVWSKSEG